MNKRKSPYLNFVVMVVVLFLITCNLLPTPTTETPHKTLTPETLQKIDIIEAYDAINSLSSFQYTTTINSVSSEEPEETSIVYEGVYVSTNYSWRTDLWVSDQGEKKMTIQFYSTGNQTWWKLIGLTDWTTEPFPFLNLEEMAKAASPFALWPEFLRFFQVGILQSGGMKTISGLECYEYKFLPVDISDTIELRMCMTSETVPLRMEFSAWVGAESTHVIQELSHINDPTNVVEPPTDLIRP